MSAATNQNNNLKIGENNNDGLITPTSALSVMEEARHPLMALLNQDEIILEEIAIASKMEVRVQHKLNQCFLYHKEMLIEKLQ